ncbi:DUF397 domain-containing protein [Streptomyces sp. HNM0663]|uniref:DUF397 domain-containing protein n=1 Tax=Streptomyces chengmaiensis TaxID=3040919 RepID=A0ABT6HEX5_9ACTN|nr:DUF397 domain-containing protein [Streptomyces chengmaiensis]MDH2387203.1 DUF397 domain-containing protein [Streptomyces chengmaiensis]
MLTSLDWKRSSYSGGGGNNCVEIAVPDGRTVAIRDSVRPTPVITVQRAALEHLLAGVRAGVLGG